MEGCKNQTKRMATNQDEKTYLPYPGADEKYQNDKDWRLYDKDKYLDPDWSPEKE